MASKPTFRSSTCIALPFPGCTRAQTTDSSLVLRWRRNPDKHGARLKIKNRLPTKGAQCHVCRQASRDILTKTCLTGCGGEHFLSMPSRRIQLRRTKLFVTRQEQIQYTHDNSSFGTRRLFEYGTRACTMQGNRIAGRPTHITTQTHKGGTP